MGADELGIDAKYQIPDELWKRMQALLLPAPKPKKKLGRTRMDVGKAMNAIFYVLRTGCQWNPLPRSLRASSTVHDRFQEWAATRIQPSLHVA
jgi:putative transposase